MAENAEHVRAHGHDPQVITTVRQLQQAFSAGKTPQQQEADDRSTITRWVMWTFFAWLFAILASLICRAVFSDRWAEAVSIEIEVLKIAIIPIVTFVLGYYFSRSTR